MRARRQRAGKGQGLDTQSLAPHGIEMRSLGTNTDHLVALSGFTLQHELALVVLLEQLYRVYTVLRGEPYHR